MNKLSNRLITITKYVDDNTKIIDVGCDHALLCVYLVNTKKNIKIIASDVNKNALQIAKDNIKKFGLEKIIETRLGNGLDVISNNEVDTIILAGMGSKTIIDIVKKDLHKLNNIKSIIIQSNTDLYYLRMMMSKMGFKILDESLIKEAGIYYVTIKFILGRKKYSKKELYFGPILLSINDSLFQIKKQEEYEKHLYVLNKIPKTKWIERIKIILKLKLFKERKLVD